MDLAHQAPLSMEFRKEYWSGLPFSSLWDLPTQGSNPSLLHCRQILYYLSHQGSPYIYIYKYTHTHTHVYTYNRILLSHKKKELLPSATFWMDCEKDKYYMISLYVES